MVFKIDLDNPKWDWEYENFRDEKLIAEIKEEEEKMKKEWILTDDDSYQHTKKVKDFIYELIQIQDNFDGEYKVFYGIIDVKFYIEKDKESVAKVISYYYGDDENVDSIQDIFDSFKEDRAYQLIAEMLFEDSIFEMSSLFHGKWEECQDFIDNYIKRE